MSGAPQREHLAHPRLHRADHLLEQNLVLELGHPVALRPRVERVQRLGRLEVLDAVLALRALREAAHERVEQVGIEILDRRQLVFALEARRDRENGLFEDLSRFGMVVALSAHVV
jgi:hypothetical protein